MTTSSTNTRGRIKSSSKRNAEFEAAIIAAPDDPAARMIYGDWLQAEGDPRGEWAAIRAGIEAAPDDVALRSAAVAFEGDHKAALFGAGAKAITRAYVGWRGGFADELRIQPDFSRGRIAAGKSMTVALRALFAHPTVRFVRHVALGALQPQQLAAAIDAMVEAQLPLLDELVVVDALTWSVSGELDAIAKLPITKLSLSGVWLESAMPRLRELTVLVGDDIVAPIARWIERGGCNQLAKLTLVEPYGQKSHSELRRAIEKSGSHAAVVVISSANLFEPEALTDKNPLLQLARRGGRAAIRHIPMAGCALYNAGSSHLVNGKPAAAAISVLDIAATLPTHLTGTWQLANAALAYEKSGDLISAELRGREAQLYSPGEPNYFAIVIDALRRTDRHAEAAKLLPRAIKAMAKPPKDAQDGGAVACLLDCMMLLAQMGNRDEALALATKFPKLVDQRIHAVVAIIQLANGQLGKARAAWKKAAKGQAHAVYHHAHAAISAHDGKLAEARKAIAAAVQANYGDMHWIANDPKLASLTDTNRRSRRQK